MQTFIDLDTNKEYHFDDGVDVEANTPDGVTLTPTSMERPTPYHDYDLPSEEWILVRAAEQKTDTADVIIAGLKSECEGAIYAGFDSDALGDTHHYDCDRHDQINLSGLKAANSGVTYPCIDGGGVKLRRVHSKPQIDVVFIDGVDHVKAQLEILGAKKEYINDATRTLAEIEAVTWISVEM